MTRSTVYVNADRTVMVRVYQPHGKPPVVEVATRETAEHVWGPPVQVEREAS